MHYTKIDGRKKNLKCNENARKETYREIEKMQEEMVGNFGEGIHNQLSTQCM